MAKIKAFFKLDLYFFENPKTVDLSHAATVLYIASIAHANRRETDGFVHRKVLRRLVDLDPTLEYELTHTELAQELVKAGLWEPAEEGWQIHDFLEHNDSSEQREGRREAERDRKRRDRAKGRPGGPEPPSGGTSSPVRSDKSGRPPVSGRTETPVRPIDVDVDVDVAEQNRDEGQINTVVEQARPIDDTTAVFQAWQEATGKHRARLDDKRRRRIREALKHYPLADVLDAVQGWQHSPFHCGQNDTATKHNDLELLLRDAKHLEEFRDLWRDGPPRQVSKQTAQAMRTSVAMRARAQARAQAEEVNDDRGRVGRSGGPAQHGLPAPAD